MFAFVLSIHFGKDVAVLATALAIRNANATRGRGGAGGVATKIKPWPWNKREWFNGFINTMRVFVMRNLFFSSLILVEWLRERLNERSNTIQILHAVSRLFATAERAFVPLRIQKKTMIYASNTILFFFFPLFAVLHLRRNSRKIKHTHIQTNKQNPPQRIESSKLINTPKEEYINWKRAEKDQHKRYPHIPPEKKGVQSCNAHVRREEAEPNRQRQTDRHHHGWNATFLSALE